MFFLKAACTWHGLDSCWRSSVLELAFGCFGTEALFCIWVPKVTCFLLAMGSNLAGVRVFWSWRSGVSEPNLCFFLMGSKGDGKHSVCVFFAWHGLESCWCFGLFESDADETLSSHRSESTFRTVFCLAEARLLLAFGCFGTEALFFSYGFQR